MKAPSFLYTISAATAACVLAFTAVSAQVPAPAPTPAQVPATPVTPTATPAAEAPIGKQCVVTVDSRIVRNTLSASALESSGFNADGTVRGTLVRLSDGWCVLKEGEAESWIPLEKVLMIRTR